MTDSQTSEMLRKLLTERGIKYRTTEVHGMPVTLYESGGRTWSVTDHPDGYLVVNCVNHTPEQAIAATLGEKPRDKTKEWLLKACNQATQDYVKALEKLVQDWQVLYEYPDYGDCIRLRRRMQELGIEVDDE